MGYQPRSSGLLGGSGRKRYGRRRQDGGRFPNLKLSETTRIKEEIPDYDPDCQYTQRELLLLAEKILLTDPKDFHEAPMILTTPMYLYRLKPEIYPVSGIPDPAIVEGLYWRTHPNGRRWASEEMRRTTGCGFYDGVIETEQELVPAPAPRQVAKKGPRPECSFDGCDRKIANVALQLCQHHYWMHHTGQELRPIGETRRFTAEQREAIRTSWDTGETHVEVATRFGTSASYAKKLRDEGRLKALGEIRFGGVGKFA